MHNWFYKDVHKCQHARLASIMQDGYLMKIDENWRMFIKIHLYSDRRNMSDTPGYISVNSMPIAIVDMSCFRNS